MKREPDSQRPSRLRGNSSRRWGVFAAAACLAYLLMTVMSRWCIGMPLLPRDLLPDLLVHLALASPVFLLARRDATGVAAVLALFALFHVPNAAKMFFLDSPLLPSDIRSIPGLIRVLPVAWTAVLLALPLLFLGLVLVNLRLSIKRGLAVAAVAAALAIPPLWYPEQVLRTLPPSSNQALWSHTARLQQRGLAPFLIEQAARNRAARPVAPEQEQVLALLPAHLRDSPPREPEGDPSRNVHLLVVEALWDANLLTAEGLDGDPFHPEFRRLWELGGAATVLSPVFGGVTANAEFELLCGIPLEGGGIPFVTQMNRPLPCLPWLLAAHGYRTVVSHPQIPDFWGRVSAYSRLGFEDYAAARGFRFDDTAGPFLQDSSLLRQNLQLLTAHGDGRPLLNYVLTIGSHFPYHLDNAKRPQVISGATRNRLVEAYANSIYYTTEAVAEYVNRLAERDPDALVLVMGDHLPVLGKGLASFARSGLFTREVSSFNAAMWVRYTAVPLLVIDGREGPQQVGDVPMYLIPELIRQRLGIALPSAAALFVEPGDPCLRRPVSGLVLEICPDGPQIWLSSRAESRASDTARWIHAVQTLRADLLGPAQHAIAPVWGSLPRPCPRHLVSLLSEPPEGCQVVVTDWGPKFTERATPFNRQPDGRSAFWFKLAESNDHVVARFRSRDLPTFQQQSLVSATLDDTALLRRPGRYPVMLRCVSAHGEVQAGTFEVRR